MSCMVNYMELAVYATLRQSVVIVVFYENET